MTAAAEPRSDALEEAARELRERHRLGPPPARPLSVWEELDALPEWLERARRACRAPEPEATKAAEWLLDNDYLVQRAALQVQEDLPAGFYRRLPSLAAGEAEGLPRVFALAHGLLRASHLQLSLPMAARFVRAYQGGEASEEDALAIGELWAFPTMLRLACLERVVTALGRLLPGLEAPFAPSALAAAPEPIDDTESVSRGIANLGTIASTPWKEFFARTSHVEAILREDPAAIYAQMDFETCDRYRRAVETLARGAGRSEPEVARGIVARAREAGGGGTAGHVGHWLVGEGRGEIERRLGYRPSLAEACGRGLLRRAAPLYGLALAAATAAAAALPAAYLLAAGAGPGPALLGTAVALLPASVVGFTFVHWAVVRIVPPRILPKLDFREGIPREHATAVVMPVVVAHRDEVPLILRNVERHRLANPDPTLRFVLLTDHADAATERAEGDAEILEDLVGGVRDLNRRHDRGARGPFHLLHRPRRFNAAEGVWMGWERKRGKLEQLNEWLAGRAREGFSLHVGARDGLDGIRFVVTADADTVLPPGSVARLAGTLAHPLNRPELDGASGRVLRGYTIVQPRVEISPHTGSSTLFARFYSGDTAIDVYSRAVSDVYQDLFGVGIFVGKGIYDVEAFRRSLEGRVPENALASHDLFEGIHGRTALASDIVVYEGFPRGYLEFNSRWHRWIRGDWALLPWLRSRVPGRGADRLPNVLPFLARWMIVDNLRRSLLPPSLLLLLVAGWLLLPGSPWVWTALATAAPGAYLLSDLVAGLARVGGRRRGAVRSFPRHLVDHAGRWLLALAFLAQDAAVALDAILRTLWRVFVSRRRLLEWTSAAHAASRLAELRSRAAVWGRMAFSPAAAALLGVAVAGSRPAALLPASPFLLAWLLAPRLALWLRRPREPRLEPLGEDARPFLRAVARRTWLFFEAFAGPDDHWLPPDNFQEEPGGEVAHRTSPTNIGMMMLCSLSACDLGYVGPRELAARLRSTLSTLERMPRYAGHFLNWYDTRALEPLEPRYVSTVDSGNLAVSLLAVKEGCRELAEGSALGAARWEGLADALALLGGAVAKLPEGSDGQLGRRISELRARAASARSEPSGWRSALGELCEREAPELDRMLGEALHRSPSARGALREIRAWLEQLHRHLRAMERDASMLLPWWTLVADPPRGQEERATELVALLPPTLSLADLPARCAAARAALPREGAERHGAASRWLEALDAALEEGAQNASDLRGELLDVATRAERLAGEMDFRMLYDEQSRLFHIGYNASAGRLDAHHYDLLASEARLASFFAIAKGDVPPEHWVFLGRPLARAHGHLALVSWGGSMFEYLMPRLLLRTRPDTLLGESERAAVGAQRRYARQLGIPWGFSESGFASLNASHDYRYRAFGVPGLGLRQGLSRDLVVAPYASALALGTAPKGAISNLRELERLGMLGAYGFFEAADFTPSRVPEGRRYWPVRCYMAHHQGMILAAIGNALTGDALVRRFHADARVRAVELLLDERVPREIPPSIVRPEEHEGPVLRERTLPALVSWTPTPRDTLAQLHALGNGRLSSWVSDAGGGGLRWHEHALTRWLPEATRDEQGIWIYVQDEESGALWSAGHRPAHVRSSETRVVFHPHLAEFHRRDHGIALGMEVGVAPGDDVEVRRITLRNESEKARALRLTSYGEVVLSPPLDDERHPVFSRLFVGSEALPGHEALLFSRRPRGPDERTPFLLHRVVADDPRVEATGFETDRAAFLGRGGDSSRPRALRRGLGASAGWTLDAVFALQARVELEPGASCSLAFVTMASGSRESVLALAERYATLPSLDWALDDARTEAAREAQDLGLEPERLPALQTLASLLLQPHPALRAEPELLRANRLGQPGLWRLAISGDHPILLLRTAEPGATALLRTLLAGHRLWRRRGLHVDLVIHRTGASGYLDPLREQVFELLRESGSAELLGRPGGVHLVFEDHVAEEERRLLAAVARAVLDERRGSLERQLEALAPTSPEPPPFAPTGRPVPEPPTPSRPRPAGLLFDNGYGGFSPDGREYVIHLEPGRSTPAPWSNVLANDRFGSLVTEAGGGFTWAENSGENRLTPWTCDPVADPPGEALYLRDEETGEIWTPTPAPAGRDAASEVRHGAGYTQWRRRSHGLEQTLCVFVPPDDPVKVSRLAFRNLWASPRRITVTCYAEWLLGGVRSLARAHVVPDYDAEHQALLARNPWSPAFAERVAFLASNLPAHGVTADRREFLGPEGDPRRPAGLARWGLSGRVVPGADCCAALQVHVDLPPETATEVIFVLGQGGDREHAVALLRRWRSPARAERGWKELGSWWEEKLGALRVKTPDAALDLMLNRWLLYQTLSSRLLARAGFYQAGGAIGFRDQLQDQLAFVLGDPERLRGHILACAEHQFEEGDVLHWWHPPTGRGVRTRCSDDLLWLPYAAAHYVEATGDASILDEELPFLSAPPLEAKERDRYAAFERSPERRSLFEHCERALERGVTRGAHGLPLIGTGDWNDGMDRVGARGRGESLWLAWFALATIRRFASLCDRRGETELAARWRRRLRELEGAVEDHGWDGRWYVRAFDDEGRPWGSADCTECRIDSISQSWAVLAGAAAPERARQALGSAARELVRGEERVARLLWPPFDTTPRDPGYIKAYPPGVRENGGQYSHAAAWLGFAHAALGEREAAARVLDLLNPIRHAASQADAERYRVEPYILAADIASVEPHAGRGGWTWYTGSAAWTWRLGVEAILGLSLREGRLAIEPCLPPGWRSFEARLRGPGGVLEVHVEDPESAGRGVAELRVDGRVVEAGPIDFPADGSTRRVEARLGRRLDPP